MRIVNHGGRCCGVKHICGLPTSPTGIATALGTRIAYQGAVGEMHNPSKDYHAEAYPKETGEERLKRLLGVIDANKSDGHLVEIVWYTAGYGWPEVFKKYGFKPVTKFKNHNTSCKLTVWHRVNPLPEKKKGE